MICSSAFATGKVGTNSVDAGTHARMDKSFAWLLGDYVLLMQLAG